MSVRKASPADVARIRYLSAAITYAAWLYYYRDAGPITDLEFEMLTWELADKVRLYPCYGNSLCPLNIVGWGAHGFNAFLSRNPGIVLKPFEYVPGYYSDRDYA